MPDRLRFAFICSRVAGEGHGTIYSCTIMHIIPKLIIMRHAKSSWNQPACRDHDRPLAPRGERAAAAIGKWLAEKDHQPAAVLCSTAARTRQTWDFMRPLLQEPGDVRFIPELYHAGGNRIWMTVRRSELSPVLVIGHNPGIGEFAASAVERAPDREEFSRYPTAAVTVCVFPARNWRGVRLNSGRLVAFTVPRDHL